MGTVTRPGLAAALLGASLFCMGNNSVGAQELRLDLPVDCQVGLTCFVQQYVDSDPGPERTDHACFSATYDGHTGTDFRVLSIAEMNDGVPVQAAARGRVKALRDGMPDRVVTEATMNTVEGRECGNGVILEHGNGWETIYCHLRLGTVAVAEGDIVDAGTRLGDIGMSGLAEFPHVEFGVRKDGNTIDPYTGRSADGVCGADAPRAPLWTAGAARVLPAPASRVLELTFAVGPVGPQDMVVRNAPWPQPQADWPALVAFAHAANLRAGDEQELILVSPDGQVTPNTSDPLSRDQAVFVTYAGRRAPEGGWPAGTYQTRYTVRRDGVVIIDERASMTIE
ncbi:MAG: M23 family metallopeptidase [Pseudomonadota bacterium]